MTQGISVSVPPSVGGDRSASFTLHRVNEMLEEQSRRIAHALHDEAGQVLASVFIRLEQATHEVPQSCGSCFQEIKQMLELIELQLRELSHDLRPAVLDDLGLVPALECLTERVSKRFGLVIAQHCLIPHRLPPSLETTLYRIVQESLTNVAKHAQASHVRIGFRRMGEVVCGSICDDGVGFDLNEVLSRKGSQGLGLLGIRERAESVGGTLHVDSQPGRGTELTINIPCGHATPINMDLILSLA